MQRLWPNAAAYPMIISPTPAFSRIRKSPHMVFIILIGFPLRAVGELKLGIDISTRQCRSPTVQCWESEVTWTQWSLCMLLVCLSRKCHVQSLHSEDCFTLPIYQMGTTLTFCPGFFPSVKYQTLCRAPFQWNPHLHRLSHHEDLTTHPLSALLCVHVPFLLLSKPETF